MIVSTNGQYICDANIAEYYSVCEESKEHVAKYELAHREYMSVWYHKQWKIFNASAKYLPDYMFAPGFKFCVSVEMGVGTSYLEAIPRIQGRLKDKYIVIIENTARILYPVRIPQIKLKYPTNGVGAENFLSPHAELYRDVCGWEGRDFFVFGDTGTWGIYFASSLYKNGREEEGSPKIRILGFLDWEDVAPLANLDKEDVFFPLGFDYDEGVHPFYLPPSYQVTV